MASVRIAQPFTAGSSARRLAWFTCVLVGLLVGALASARAGVEVGQQAPDFALPDQNGTTHHLSDYRGKTVILAFYPKAATPG